MRPLSVKKKKKKKEWQLLGKKPDVYLRLSSVTTHLSLCKNDMVDF